MSTRSDGPGFDRLPEELRSRILDMARERSLPEPLIESLLRDPAALLAELAGSADGPGADFDACTREALGAIGEVLEGLERFVEEGPGGN